MIVLLTMKYNPKTHSSLNNKNLKPKIDTKTTINNKCTKFLITQIIKLTNPLIITKSLLNTNPTFQPIHIQSPKTNWPHLPPNLNSFITSMVLEITLLVTVNPTDKSNRRSRTRRVMLRWIKSTLKVIKLCTMSQNVDWYCITPMIFILCTPQQFLIYRLIKFFGVH